MILGIDDIAGGATILSLLAWLGLTFMYYIVCYLAVLNIIYDLNSPFKIAQLLLASAPAAFLMALFNYQPLILCILMGISNFHRIKALNTPNNLDPAQTPKKLFYKIGYIYIIMVCALAFYLQTPVNGKPYWETLIPQ